MSIAILIQARMTSTRFPGKVMADIAGKPMLQHIIERCRQVDHEVPVVGLFPAADQSKSLAALANRLGIHYRYGPEHDVLGRYAQACTMMNLQTIVRITGDCPLVDPEVVRKVIKLRKTEKADYASNIHPRSFPKGLDVEVFTREELMNAYHKATDLYDREHVTPFIIANAKRKVNLASGHFNIAEMNWCVDTREDLKFIRAMHKVREPKDLNDGLSIMTEIARGK